MAETAIVLLGILRPLGILFLIGLVSYFLPTLIALIRGHHQTAPILVRNFLLGWTFIGWVAALVWSVSRVER